jgi:hypothetical protein
MKSEVIEAKGQTAEAPAWRRCLASAGIALALVGLPLAGAVLAGLPLDQLTEFPPRSLYVRHAPFSWPVFVVLAAGILGVVLPLAWRVLRSQSQDTQRPTSNAQLPTSNGNTTTLTGGSRSVGRWVLDVGCWALKKPFPWWGWLALAFGGAAWVLAWTRFDWFAPLQRFTFTPLWIAYIVVVNAFTFRRTGRCLLLAQPGRLLLLAGVSAVFWWYFEYLNRFVQNWVYVNVGDFSPPAYALFATLPFATVLPAVAGTEELLATFPRLTAGLDACRPVRLTPATGRGLCAFAAASLFCLPFFPNALFPLLWVAPALLLAGTAIWRGQPCVLDTLDSGDGRRLARLALAALACGFFWEMWNACSLAKWQYLVPYVNRFHLFEMPALGYAGYLPFGIECALVADVLLRRHGQDNPLHG